VKFDVPTPSPKIEFQFFSNLVLNEISLVCTGDAKWHQGLTVFCSQKDEGEKSFSKLTVPCDKKG
jgi:hypothetical protein